MFRVAVARSRRLLPPRAAAALSSFSAASTAPLFPSRAAAAAAAEAAAAAAAGAGAEAAAAAAAPPPAAPRRWGRSLLKFGAFAALTGALGAVGYVTHAYTLTEVALNTQEFRKMMTTPPHIEEDATEFEKFQAMALAEAKKVPVAAIEFYLDTRNTIENHVTGFTEPTSDKLLPDLLPEYNGVITLVLDLNETLVYSDWQRDRGWKTFKRPGVDAFVQYMSQFYEVVVYSDQTSMYVDPVIERLDPKGYIMYRLSRPATKYQDGKHYRDLSKLNRKPEHVLYISAHALESCLQLENCVSIKPWKLETDDTQLLDLIPFLEYLATARPTDVRPVLASFQGQDIATEFAKRAKVVGRQKQERKSIWRR
ncbi:mitochondrial import inner membrane translocase subunit TIM50-like [Lolium rigidum]|uniref:mitochondrial import inner membrane translocase subunit TIM50-like n=1 Tax=Lolium rigidum TaxID=89674 RepID=UPI001F5D3E91|nr:mitochondrial import inner membrane translocase subunit TIM50-like [Lolium rigidum]